MEVTSGHSVSEFGEIRAYGKAEDDVILILITVCVVFKGEDGGGAKQLGQSHTGGCYV